MCVDRQTDESDTERIIMLTKIKSIIIEYGFEWAANRFLYSMKLKAMKWMPSIEVFFEKKTQYPQRLDLFHIDIEQLKFFLHGLDKVDQNNLIVIADKACKGIVLGFSSIDLDYGNPIDWQLNPITNRRCNEKAKWYTIPDFDNERGDIKAIWEASRFSHFLILVRAFLLTENTKYYQACSEQLSSWLQSNPYSYGANYKCGQECSLRMANVLFAYSVFSDAGIITDEDTSNVKEFISRNYRKVLSNFFYAYKCIKNNHTISELMGIILGAWCCDDQKRLEKAYILLDKVIDEQFTTDGGYKQFSFNYQRLALQDLECVLSIEQRTGHKLKSRDKITKAAMLMYQCQDENGDMPNYGANDGALIFPMTACDYRDFRPIINTIYALTTGKEMYKPGKHQEELLWFGCKPMHSIEQINRNSAQFMEAGLFTIRSNRSWSMIVLNEYKSRPAHLDQLHFDLWVDGINVFCDSGTYSYACDIGVSLRGTEGHNTLKIKDKDQMKQHGSFMIYDWTKRKEIQADKNTIEGKMYSQSGYYHKRKVTYTGGEYQLIDETDEKYAGNFQLLFHTPCSVDMTDGRIMLSYEGKALCELISDGIVRIEKSIRSLYYLRQEEDTCVIIQNGKKTCIKIQE